jgi:hypothetical protein
MTRDAARMELWWLPLGAGGRFVGAGLLARAGLAVETIRPPAGGRAPGWAAGVAVARRRRQELGEPAHARSHGRG